MAKAAVSKFKQALASINSEVDGIRTAIGRLKGERHRIEQMPVPLAEALEKLDSYIAQCRPKDLALLDLIHPGTGIPKSLDIVPGIQVVAPVTGGVAHTVVPMDAIERTLIWLFPEAMRERLSAELKALYTRIDHVLTDEARTQALEDIDAQVLSLEYQEEALVCEAESAGLPLLRRGDADPRAVLNVEV